MTQPPPTGNKFTFANAAKGAAFAVLLQWSTRAIGFVSVAILARLLTPADFGLMAIANTVVVLVEVFSYVGFRVALIRMPSPERSHYDTAWTLQLAINSVLALVLASVAAPAAAKFYGRPEIFAILAILSAKLVFAGLTNVGVVDFEREIRFDADFRMRIVARLVAFVVAVAGAFTLRSYWALVWGLLAQSAMLAAMSYAFHPFRPRFSVSRWRDMLGVSIWMLVAGVAQTVVTQIERLVVGRIAVDRLVGFYSVSKDVAHIFTHEIAIALNRVSLVSLSRAIDAQGQARDQFVAAIGAYAMVAAPMSLGLAATADLVVPVILGSQWGDAAVLLPPLAVSVGFQAIYASLMPALIAMHRVRDAALVNLAWAAVLTAAVVGIAVMIRNPAAVAWTALGVNAVFLLAALVIIGRVAHVALARLAGAVARPYAAAVVMYLAVTHLPLLGAGMPVIGLAEKVAAGGVVFAAGAILIWLISGRPAGIEQQVLLQVRAMIVRRAA